MLVMWIHMSAVVASWYKVTQLQSNQTDQYEIFVIELVKY